MGKRKSTSDHSQVVETWGSEVPDSGVSTAPAARSASGERDPDYNQATKDAYTGTLPGYEEYRSKNIDQYADVVREASANIDMGGARLPTDREPTREERDAASAGYRANQDSKPRLATFDTAQGAEATVAELFDRDSARRANLDPHSGMPLAQDDPRRRETQVPMSQSTSRLRVLGVDYDSYREMNIPVPSGSGRQSVSYPVSVVTATVQIKIPARDYAEAFPEKFAAMNEELTQRGLDPVRANRQADVDAGKDDRVDHVFHDTRIPLVGLRDAKNVVQVRGGFPVVNTDLDPERLYIKPVTNEDAVAFVKEQAAEGIDLQATNRVLREAVGLPPYGDINRRADGTMLPESERRTLPTLASFLDPANGFDKEIVDVATKEAKGRLVAHRANVAAQSVMTVYNRPMARLFAYSAGITTTLQATGARGRASKEPQGSLSVNRDHELTPSRRPPTPRVGGFLRAYEAVHAVDRSFSASQIEALYAKQQREQAAKSRR